MPNALMLVQRLSFFGVIALLLCSLPAAAQSTVVSSIVNLASGQDSLSPGVLAAIFGNNLDLLKPDTVPISVTLSGLPVSLLYRSPQQLTVQLPVQAQPGSAMLQIASQGLFSVPFPLRLQDFAPGIFTSAGTLGLISHLNGAAVSMTNPAQPDEALSLQAVGLGPTMPLIATGIPAPASPVATTVTTPSISVDGQNATIQQAGLQPSSIGRYQVFFTVPPSLSSGNHLLSLTIGKITSNTVVLVTAGQGQPSINSVENGGSFAAGAVAPGSIASIFGLNFGQQDNLSLFPATSFQGLSVTFNSIRAPLIGVVPSSGQINAFVPTELQEFGVANVQVTALTGASTIFPVQLAPAAPGLFRITDPSRIIKNNAAALFANTRWLVVPQSLSSALQIPQNCLNPASVCGQPARAGDLLQIYITGLGRATIGGDPNGTVLPTGSVAPTSGDAIYRTIDTPVVTVGDVSAKITFSGIAPGYAGLYQINIQIPTGVPAGDQVQLKISTTNGLSDTATIAVQP
jgi:uncharacterized protein (TIGR03437 family)